MKNYKEFTFWRKAHSLALEVYNITKSYPKEETYGMISQLRRAALSIPNNIAEGCGRDTKNELKRFLVIASGSASEVEYLLYFSKDIGYITDEQYLKLENQIIEIKRALTSYKNKIGN